MKLISYEFFSNQDEFRIWQIAYPEFAIHAVTPVTLQQKASVDVEKYGTAGVVDTMQSWGVFVTYGYESMGNTDANITDHSDS